MFKKKVPAILKNLFILHFVIDVFIAIPLMIAPVESLRILGWGGIDSLMTRVVAAALFGIGLESWFSRNAKPESYKSMLHFKVLWSGFAILGIAITIIEKGNKNIYVWGALGIFIVFHVIWLYWYNRLKSKKK